MYKETGYNILPGIILFSTVEPSTTPGVTIELIPNFFTSFLFINYYDNEDKGCVGVLDVQFLSAISTSTLVYLYITLRSR